MAAELAQELRGKHAETWQGLLTALLGSAMSGRVELMQVARRE